MVKKLKNYCATVGNGILFFLIFFLLLCSKSTHAQSRTIETAGDVLLFTLPATALTTSLIIKDYEGTWQFAKSALLNQAVTIGLKYATGKSRPYNNGERAFPSGHTSTTFQSAAYIQKRYGWKFGIPAYALAGFTGYSRMNAKMHDGWDVLAGALIGIGSSYLFTSPYQKEHMELTFASDADSISIGFRYKF
ncbi:lipid A 1-phosphatase [Arenibacter sp. NBRC 103722]|uniref:phosphatase PAP2 family protein n=1 Tax=Arenibacter sp. NBRC 103722 TaxID=1113929 RepID=UPI000853E058|nr:phosphatase PAP2 family protein [Arenibacter sp. NBRC 103722]GBF21566.1 lipid A 1-phosphatase [Arenibacter sp. NBRC 103722]